MWSTPRVESRLAAMESYCDRRYRILPNNDAFEVDCRPNRLGPLLLEGDDDLHLRMGNTSLEFYLHHSPSSERVVGVLEEFAILVSVPVV